MIGRNRIRRRCVSGLHPRPVQIAHAVSIAASANDAAIIDQASAHSRPRGGGRRRRSRTIRNPAAAP
jgi:hypothetical protein